MEKFKKFKISNPKTIFGGDLYATYIGEGGDFYDSDKRRYVILIKN